MINHILGYDFEFSGELDIAFLFLKDTPIELSYRNFTYWFAARYGLSSLMLMFLLPYLKRMGRGDSLVCAMGLSSKMAALLLLAFSTSTTMVFIGKSAFSPCLSIRPDLFRLVR